MAYYEAGRADDESVMTADVTYLLSCAQGLGLMLSIDKLDLEPREDHTVTTGHGISKDL